MVEGTGDAAIDLLAVKRHRTGGGGVDADDGAADGGLAGAGFAHQPERLALKDVEGDAVDGGEGMAAGAEAHGEVFNVQQFLAFSAHASPSFRSRRAMMSGFSTFGARGSSSQVRALWVGETSK